MKMPGGETKLCYEKNANKSLLLVWNSKVTVITVEQQKAKYFSREIEGYPTMQRLKVKKRNFFLRNSGHLKSSDER